jgi:hypothetical protein
MQIRGLLLNHVVGENMYDTFIVEGKKVKVSRYK